MMMTQLTSLLMIGFALSFATGGCSSPSEVAPGDASSSTANASPTASASPTAAQVMKIVFVGKQNACDCTRKTVDAGWAALQKALSTPAKLPVERLQIDMEGEKVAPYRKQKPIMALPAIYLLDGKNVVLELLQGEVSEAQITAALGK